MAEYPVVYYMYIMTIIIFSRSQTTDDSPHADTVRGYPTDRFEVDTDAAVGDTILQRDARETLSYRPAEVGYDPHSIPTTATKMRQRPCTSHRSNVERRHFMPMLTLYARAHDK